jgi:uncharacterized membrane protein
LFIQSIAFLLTQLTTNAVWLERWKWIATAFVMMSAAVVSFSIALSLNPATFIGFLIAHIMWTFAGVIMKDKPIIALNGFFILIDVYAIIIRL